MTSKLGLHWLRVHPDGRDYSHIEKMQYKSAKLFEWQWSNRDACRDLLAVLPKDSYILARDHPLSEQKSDMFRDPVGTGTRHANEWAMKVASGQVHTPVERTFFLGINEPDATTGDRNAIDLYTEAILRRLEQHGLRGGAFNFSTGHPRTVDGTGNTAADYSVFERSHRAIVDGHHIAVLHIYGTASVPCAPGHYDRLKACTWQDVEWVVGEMGADEHVVGGGKHDGYLISMVSNPPAYCAWLDTLIIGIDDARIHSYEVFSYDYSHPWSSFDTRPIRDALESHQWRHMQVQPTTPTTPPVTVHIPSVGTGTPATPAYVIVKAGANLRAAPITGQVITAIPYGERIDIIGVMDTSGWLKVRYRDHEGYMAAQLVGLVAPEPLPAPSEGPEPTPVPPNNERDNWTRAIAFVMGWEGEYQNVANDAGNWTGCAVGKGELKGTKYGISACSYPNLDIINITKEQAASIYYTDYWQRSTADRLEWPLCLAVFDTAVLHGVGTAQKWLAEVGPNPYLFAARRLRSYTKMENWGFWGKAWTLRVADLLEVMGK